MPIASPQRALLALALGAFCIATGEFVSLGLLPDLASSYDVTIPQAGHLISAYALGVVVGGPLLTVVAIRWTRKRFLLMLTILLAIGNLASGLVPSFHGLLVIRFLAGLPHAAYFGAAAVAAGNLVETGRRNAAMAVVLTGFTIANVVGVPLTIRLGQQAGWRTAFMFVGLLELIAAVGILCLVPRQEQQSRKAPRGLIEEVKAFRNVQVWLALGIAAIGGGALFSTSSYITPMMTRLAGYSETSMPWLLVLLGIGMTTGNLVGARMANGGLMRTIYFSLSAQALVALVFVFASHDKIAATITIVLFPFTTSLMLPPLQARIIMLADGAPNLASAAIHSAFNVANSLGAWLGGMTIAAGLGYASPNLVAAWLAVLGLILAIVSMGLSPGLSTRRLDFFTDDEKAQLRALAATASLRSSVHHRAPAADLNVVQNADPRPTVASADAGRNRG
ncbi:MAG TPA: MFS transporter [Kineosporiaceae bacterium]|nr:MFS transporter [Kineosporiaceae bacterium]